MRNTTSKINSDQVTAHTHTKLKDHRCLRSLYIPRNVSEEVVCRIITLLKVTQGLLLCVSCRNHLQWLNGDPNKYRGSYCRVCLIVCQKGSSSKRIRIIIIKRGDAFLGRFKYQKRVWLHCITTSTYYYYYWQHEKEIKWCLCIPPVSSKPPVVLSPIYPPPKPTFYRINLWQFFVARLFRTDTMMERQRNKRTGVV